MKIRIQGNSVRLRLSKTDVQRLVNEGCVTENTTFENAVFSYQVEQSDDIEQLSAAFENSKITMRIPASLVKNWDTDDRVGFENDFQTSTSGVLYLLVEKDFKCLDRTTENQADHYENPNKTC